VDQGCLRGPRGRSCRLLPRLSDGGHQCCVESPAGQRRPLPPAVSLPAANLAYEANPHRAPVWYKRPRERWSGGRPRQLAKRRESSAPKQL